MSVLANPTTPRHSAVKPSPIATGTRRFRPDIQGLRAIAVLLVVLYHAKVPGVRGGFVGVDVFFVISGFLITGQLVREVEKHGRIIFSGFYFKRIRRLLPPAAIVVITTLLVSRIWAPLLQTKALGTDTIFVAFYGLNYRLASEGINYQNENAAPSALQHFWSLAVEEQYYVLWPMIIMIIVLLSRRWWRQVLPMVLTAGILVSLYMSQILLHSDQPLSYFSIQSRAWELGIGALVALTAHRLVHLPHVIRQAASWGGLVAILVSGFCYTDGTSFPGYNALLPVVGAALVIVAGCAGPAGAEILLDRRPMQGLGKVSYTWYLWHWPFLILAPLLAPSFSFTWLLNLEMMVLALWFAIITYYLVEYPLRELPLRKPTWLGIGFLTSGVTATAGFVASASVVAALSASAAVQLGTSGDPFIGTANSGPVSPSVVTAVKDTPHYPADCILSLTATKSPPCLIGPNGRAADVKPNSNRVVLLGDSHAGQWFAPIHSFAAADDLAVEVLNKDGCPLATITVVNSALDRTYTECNIWRSSVLRRLAREPRPRIIFISSLNWYTNNTAELDAGWAVTLKVLKAIGAPIVYLEDTPHPTFDVPTCVSSSLNDWSKCAFKRASALRADPLLSGSLDRDLTAVVDVNQFLCPGTGPMCPSVRGSVLLYRDTSHVTNTAMAAFTPSVEAQLKAANLKPKHIQSAASG